jgi:hypothetical protein
MQAVVSDYVAGRINREILAFLFDKRQYFTNQKTGAK